MAGRTRILPPVVMAPSHSHPEGVPCFVGTETAISTMTLGHFGSFAAIVVACEGPSGGVAVLSVLDRDEVEEHIRLLRNAIDDAERVDQGLPPIHAPKGTN